MLPDLAVPFGLFLSAQFALFVATILADVPYFDAETWARWDSGLYGQIATDGYDLFRCPTRPAEWCGNAGWFPAYPAVMAPIVALGVPAAPVGVVVSAIFAFATLALIWLGPMRAEATPRNVLTLVFAAFIPGMVYHHAVFPTSMAAFFLVLTIWLATKHRWVPAGLAAVVAAASYPTVILLAPVFGLWVLLTSWRDGVKAVVFRGAMTAGATVLGFVTVLAIQGIQTGRFDAFFIVQAKYNHTTIDPFSSLVNFTGPVLRGELAGFGAMRYVETLFVAVVMISVLVYSARRWRTLTSADLLVLIFALTFWLVPLAQQFSLYRKEALLMPLVLLLRQLPVAVLTALVGGAVTVAIPLAAAYFENILT